MCDNKILCEYDYEERMVFANLAYNQSNLAHIKQQAARSVAGKVRVFFKLAHPYPYFVPSPLIPMKLIGNVCNFSLVVF